MLRRLSAAVLAVAALSAPAQQPGDVQAQLERIRQVGREGARNAEAARAWKAVVAAGPSALLSILGAMDDDDLTAANWLRPAFEAVAEKALQAGQLPKAELEKFLSDRKKAGIARRVAYEWIVKADPAAPDRLLPGMLQDPSPELRRDAVALAIRQADRLAEKKDAAARDAYRKALAGACDQDQVEAIAKALERFGEKVDLPKHFGFVTAWQLIGPFEHHKGVGWDVAYPPEKGIDLAASYDGKGGEKVAWKAHTTADAMGMVNLNKALGNHKGAVAYALATVDSPAERLVELRTGCINGLKIFLNGKEVFAREEYHHGMRVDQYAPRGPLKKGRNVILLKVCQNEQKDAWAQAWQFQLRLCDAAGAAVPFTQPAAAKKEGK